MFLLGKQKHLLRYISIGYKTDFFFILTSYIVKRSVCNILADYVASYIKLDTNSSILWWIWLNFMAQYLCWFFFFFFFFLGLIQFSRFVFRISQFFGRSTTEGTQVVEMRIWCIKIGIVLVLYSTIWSFNSALSLNDIKSDE